MNFYQFFSTFVGHFSLLDPDPDSEYGSGSGSTDPIEYGSHTDPDPVPDPDPQPCFWYVLPKFIGTVYFWLQKMVVEKKFPPPLLVLLLDPGSAEIRDGQKSGSGINI
jgi:hypothetical protein